MNIPNATHESNADVFQINNRISVTAVQGLQLAYISCGHHRTLSRMSDDKHEQQILPNYIYSYFGRNRKIDIFS